MLHLVLSSIAALVYVIGGVFMTRGGVSNLLVVYGCFILGASLQLWATRHVSNMSLTYLIILGLEAALSMGLGVMVLQERFSNERLLGVVLVIAGIAVLRGR